MDLVIISFSTLLIVLYAGFVLKLNQVLRKFQTLPSSQDEEVVITLVIPFRNEARHLPKLLGALEGQVYEPFEVIMINDHSLDESVQIIKEYQRNAKLGLKVIEAPENCHGKKACLALAIAQAKGEIIVQTDADCGMGPGWLGQVIRAFDKNTLLVAGPVKMIPTGGFWSRFAALEFLSLQASGAALMIANKPVMVSAANFAYRKSVYHSSKNAGISKSSGDDVFLLQEVVRKYGANRVKMTLNPEAVVVTEAPAGFSEFLLQRARWGGKTASYSSPLAISIAAFIATTALWMLFVFFYGLANWPFLGLAILLWLLKGFADYPLLKNFAQSTGQKKLMSFFSYSAVLYPFYILVTGFVIIFLPGKILWKGRSIQKYGSAV